MRNSQLIPGCPRERTIAALSTKSQMISSATASSGAKNPTHDPAKAKEMIHVPNVSLACGFDLLQVRLSAPKTAPDSDPGR